MWWYADLVDRAGNGAVLIWSLGLPFLSGSRNRPIARSRPSLNIATYRSGQPDFYLLQEYPEEAAHVDWATGSGTIGDTVFQVEKTPESVRLEVRLSAEVPNSSSRLSGRLLLEGPRLHLPDSDQVAGHVWSPQSTTAGGSFGLSSGESAPFRIQGRGYFDGNSDETPLHDQGIESWRWGRISFDDHSFVYYDIDAEDGSVERHVFLQGTSDDSNGLVQPDVFVFRRGEPRLGTYGLTSPRSFRIETSVGTYAIECEQLVDDSPFYQRFLARGHSPSGQRGVGISEVVVPGRVDRPWQRRFVRMRTHHLTEKNSPFLPLFSGSRVDRLGRLARSLTLLGGKW